nr:ribonuclease H-like domain-containing protein [Tanacetum cinerariifolium]
MPPPEEVPITTAHGTDQAVEIVAVEPPAVRESRKRGHKGIDANAPPKSQRRDHADLRPSDNTSGTNEAVNIAHDVSAASSQGQAFALTYADDVTFFFFSNQSNSLQLENEDLEQIDTDDLEEVDLKWQVAMLTKRVMRFIKKTGRNLNFSSKETVGFDKTK